MKCEKCGFENLDEAIYCIKCGNRLDGKIACPKCGEYISRDAEFCPKCGKSIPHNKESDKQIQETFEEKKSKIARIFNRVSFFVTLAFFVLFIAQCFRQYLSTSEKSEFILYFIDYFGKDYSALDNLTKSMMITRTIVLAIDISVTIAFSTIGIKKLVQSRKNQSEINNAYKYLSIVLASKVLTSMMLINTQAGTFAGYSDNLSKLIFGCAFHLYVCLAFDTFLFFKKGQISIFIARIILSFGLFIPLIVIGSFNDSYLYFASTNEGFIYHFVKMIVEMNSDASYISSFVLTSFSLACIFIIVTICYFIVTFFTSSYFGGMNRFKRFRIIFYMSTITLSIISTMFMISSIIEANLYGAYLNTPVKNSVAPYIAFVMSFLLVGVSIATFNIYNRANRREKLAEKTTIK